jgi:hypothetical protein
MMSLYYNNVLCVCVCVMNALACCVRAFVGSDCHLFFFFLLPLFFPLLFLPLLLPLTFPFFFFGSSGASGNNPFHHTRAVSSSRSCAATTMAPVGPGGVSIMVTCGGVRVVLSDDERAQRVNQLMYEAQYVCRRPSLPHMRPGVRTEGGSGVAT